MSLFTIVRRNPLVLPLAGVAALAMLFVSEVSYWKSIRTIDEIGATQTARGSLQSLPPRMHDASTAARAFVVDGRATDLQAFEAAAADIGGAIEAIDRHYRAEAERPEGLASLKASAAGGLSLLATAIRQRQQASAPEPPDAAMLAADEAQWASIRKLVNDLLARESARLEADRGELKRTLLLSRVGMAALIAFSLLALFIYLRHARSLRQQVLEQQHLVQDERDRLDVEVRLRTAQLTQLARHLQTAREDERHRLARNLHDELGALLTSAKLDAARIKARLAGTAPEALERLAHLVQTLDSSIALGRRIVEDLRPSTLANLGLVPTLEILAREFADRAGFAVHCDLEPVRLSPAAELVVYRLVQESITNISKHANAHEVWLRLGAEGGRVMVSVRDDGVGFDPVSSLPSAYGLVGMRFRVESEGGTLSVESALGQGTTVRVSLPELVQAPT